VGGRYKVLLRPAARRDLDRMERRVCERLLRAILALGTEPRPRGARKLVGGKKEWRLRVGVWRVLYEIDDEEKVVRIFRVRHRRDVYRF